MSCVTRTVPHYLTFSFTIYSYFTSLYDFLIHHLLLFSIAFCFQMFAGYVSHHSGYETIHSHAQQETWQLFVLVYLLLLTTSSLSTSLDINPPHSQNWYSFISFNGLYNTTFLMYFYLSCLLHDHYCAGTALSSFDNHPLIFIKLY